VAAEQTSVREAQGSPRKAVEPVADISFCAPEDRKAVLSLRERLDVGGESYSDVILRLVEIEGVVEAVGGVNRRLRKTPNCIAVGRLRLIVKLQAIVPQ